MYGQAGCVEVDLPYDFFTANLLDFPYSISATGYSLQGSSWYSDDGEVS